MTVRCVILQLLVCSSVFAQLVFEAAEQVPKAKPGQTEFNAIYKFKNAGKLKLLIVGQDDVTNVLE